MAFFKETILGRIGMEEKDGYITDLWFACDDMQPDADQVATPLLKEAFQQLELYLKGELREFTLPLNPPGTDFMKSVWEKLIEVPYGQTASYKDIAVAVGKPKAMRAVGMANSRNPIAIIIPCHRIIGSNGDLVGYSSGLELKQKLLDLEKQQ